MKAYGNIIHLKTNPSPKYNQQANLCSLDERSQRRIESLQKMNLINPLGPSNKNKSFGHQKILHSDRIMHDPQFQKESRSQSPLRARDLLEKKSLIVSSFKSSKFKNSQKSSISVHGTPNKKYSIYEIGANHSSSKIINSSKLSQDQLKTFEAKYSLKFTEGYSERILDKCVELLQTEDNAIVLENILPGKYTKYMTNTLKPHMGLITSVHHNSYQFLKNSFPLSTKGMMLPPLLNTPKSTKSENQAFDFIGNINADRKDQSFNSNSKEEDSEVASFSQFSSLPKVSTQSFKDSLSLMTNPLQKTSLVLITAKNKTFTLEFGFCEVVLDEGKILSAQISRYFIGKIYRKLRLVEVLTIKLMDYFFQRHHIERISIDILANNDSIQKEMQNIGFKLQKVDKVAFKYKTYTLWKKDFYLLLNELTSKVTEA